MTRFDVQNIPEFDYKRDEVCRRLPLRVVLVISVNMESVTCRFAEYGHSQFDGCLFNVRGFSEAGVILCAFLALKVDSVLNSSVTCLKLAEQPFGRLRSIAGQSEVPRR